MSHSILLAGAGQLGSRYLQGAAAYSVPLEIDVFDCSLAALDKAAARWDEVPKMASHKVRYLSNLANIKPKFDLVINSTTANNRYRLISELYLATTASSWVLEKVLVQDIESLDLLERLLMNSNVWVNTPRRSWVMYKKLRSEFGNEPIQVTIQGLQGLACNGIHFIDLLCPWNNSNIVNVDTSTLAEKWHQSKRLGFYDVFGTIKVNFNDGSAMHLSSSIDDHDLTIVVSSSSKQWVISSNETIAVCSDGKSIVGQIELQSAKTKNILESIFSLGQCDLPTLSQSVEQHRVFLSALLVHWRNSGMHGNTLLIT